MAGWQDGKLCEYSTRFIWPDQDTLPTDQFVLVLFIGARLIFVAPILRIPRKSRVVSQTQKTILVAIIYETIHRISWYQISASSDASQLIEGKVTLFQFTQWVLALFRYRLN